MYCWGRKEKHTVSKQHWKQTVLCSSNIFLFYLIEHFRPKKQSFEVRAIADVPRMNGFVERFVIDKDLRKILDERDIEIVDLAVRSVAFLLEQFDPLDQLLSRLRLVGRSVLRLKKKRMKKKRQNTMTFRSEPLWEGESCTYRVGRHAWATKIDRFLKFS